MTIQRALNLVAIAVAAFTVAILIPATTVYSRAEAKELDEPPLYSPQSSYTVVYAEISAYTSSVDETDDTPFLTASGAVTGHGTLACPRKYPFGTKVEIAGKLYTCEDRMAQKYRDREVFDMWTESKSIAYQWGRRNVNVKIYE